MTGRGCAEQIFVMRQLTEKMIKMGKKLCAVFVDLEKAYDKVCREELWESLRRYGVSGGLLKMIKSMYQASEACVRVDGEVSEWFEVKQGVRQGCPLSPWLFNIFLDMVVREARTNFYGVKLDTCQVQVLLFADDTVLITEREEDLQHNNRALQTAVKEHKLAVNWTKTNTMAIGREITGCKVEVDGHNVENVSEAVYLGVKFSEDGRMEGELERRIGIRMSTVGAMVVPMMTYGCESWVLREKEISRLQATEMRISRKVAGVTRMDHIRSEEIRHRLQQRSIVDVVRERRERWRVKVMEKPENDIIITPYMYKHIFLST